LRGTGILKNLDKYTNSDWKEKAGGVKSGPAPGSPAAKAAAKAAAAKAPQAAPAAAEEE